MTPPQNFKSCQRATAFILAHLSNVH